MHFPAPHAAFNPSHNLLRSHTFPALQAPAGMSRGCGRPARWCLRERFKTQARRESTSLTARAISTACSTPGIGHRGSSPPLAISSGRGATQASDRGASYNSIISVFRHQHTYDHHQALTSAVQATGLGRVSQETTPNTHHVKLSIQMSHDSHACQHPPGSRRCHTAATTSASTSAFPSRRAAVANTSGMLATRACHSFCSTAHLKPCRRRRMAPQSPLPGPG